MGEAGILEPCGTGGEKEGEHVLPRQAQACVHGKAEGVCLLTNVHETLVSVSPLCCMFALSRLQGTECDRREGKPCPLPPLEVIPVVLKT